jgi:truncated hemoglobin YjbI
MRFDSPTRHLYGIGPDLMHIASHKERLVSNTIAPRYQTENGYLTQTTRKTYIKRAVEFGRLPPQARHMETITSLQASHDPQMPIQFWQLFSVLGPEPIVGIVTEFYQRVFDDEPWFTSVFAQVGNLNHHILTQASMWLDVMVGGPYYHGAEFRLNFHHVHNAHSLMNEKGARRWVTLMVDALEASGLLMSDDPRVRVSLNTFLAHFYAKYAQDFKFENRETFGPINPPVPQ